MLIPAARTLVLMLILCGWYVAAAPEENVVGTVKTTHAGALVLRGAGTTFLREGTHILLNDTLRTPTSGGLAGDPNVNQIVIDVEGWRPVAGDCQPPRS